MKQITATLAAAVILASAALYGQDTVASKLKEDLGHLVGKWESIAKSGETENKGAYVVEWGPQKACIIWKAESRSVTTGEEVHGCGIMGGDPREGVLREQSFSTDGSALTSQYKELSPLVFEGKRHGTAQGKKTRAKLTVKWESDRSAFEWKATDYYIGDEKQPDLVIKFRRL